MLAVGVKEDGVHTEAEGTGSTPLVFKTSSCFLQHLHYDLITHRKYYLGMNPRLEIVHAVCYRYENLLTASRGSNWQYLVGFRSSQLLGSSLVILSRNKDKFW